MTLREFGPLWRLAIRERSYRQIRDHLRRVRVLLEAAERTQTPLFTLFALDHLFWAMDLRAYAKIMWLPKKLPSQDEMRRVLLDLRSQVEKIEKAADGKANPP